MTTARWNRSNATCACGHQFVFTKKGEFMLQAYAHAKAAHAGDKIEVTVHLKHDVGPVRS